MNFHFCLQYWIFFFHSGLIFSFESQKCETNYVILLYFVMYLMSKMLLLWRALFLRMYISFLANGRQLLASMIQSLG